MNFSKRSYQKELLDRDDIPAEDIRQNMQELQFINNHLGGHEITLAGLSKLLQNSKNNHKEIIIGEIGCGGGDNLSAIFNWCKKKNINTRLIGIDINADCVNLAAENLKETPHQLLHSDYRMVEFHQEKPDILFTSLFCHHFTNEELVEMMQWMKENSGLGFFINDLHRHAIAYYSIKFLTSLFSHSYLVKHDAPLSVRRGFKKEEWEKIFSNAGIIKYSIEWKWAFRYLITVFAN